MLKKISVLNGNTLKILAAIFMVLDHVGVLLFPSVTWLRIVGRLSFPLFAFMISEGARYTKNKFKYFITMFSLAVICQLVYYFFDSGSLYMCILVTFSISVLLIYLLNFTKKMICDKEQKLYLKILLVIAFFAACSLVYFINTSYFTELTGVIIDYGFAGSMAPVFASLFDFRGIEVSDKLRRLDCIPARVACFAVGLMLLTYEVSLSVFASVRDIQFWSLLTVPLLLMYSGERGKLKMKYFFYLFYPLHLVILYGIFFLMMMGML